MIWEWKKERMHLYEKQNRIKEIKWKRMKKRMKIEIKVLREDEIWMSLKVCKWYNKKVGDIKWKCINNCNGKRKQKYKDKCMKIKEKLMNKRSVKKWSNENDNFYWKEKDIFWLLPRSHKHLCQVKRWQNGREKSQE